MGNKDVSSNPTELQIKRLFVKKQQELKEYVADLEKLPLNSILYDPVHVRSLEDFYAVKEEEKVHRKIRRITKKLAMLKKKNVDISSLSLRLKKKDLSTFDSIRHDVNAKKVAVPETNLEECVSLFPLATAMNKQDGPVDPHAIFKAEIEQIKLIKKVPIEVPHVTRNLAVSSSHTQFIRKLERSETTIPQAVRSSGEITTTTSFHNGTFKVITDEKPKGEESPSAPSESAGTKKKEEPENGAEPREPAP